MSNTCPTVKVKADNEQGFAVIDEHAFDPTKHELFDVPVSVADEAAKPARKFRPLSKG